MFFLNFNSMASSRSVDDRSYWSDEVYKSGVAVLGVKCSRWCARLNRDSDAVALDFLPLHLNVKLLRCSHWRCPTASASSLSTCRSSNPLIFVHTFSSRVPYIVSASEWLRA